MFVSVYSFINASFRKHIFFSAICALTLRYHTKFNVEWPNYRFVSLHPGHNIAYTPYVGVYMVIKLSYKLTDVNKWEIRKPHLDKHN
jgi:hypothetical protein